MFRRFDAEPLEDMWPLKRACTCSWCYARHCNTCPLGTLAKSLGTVTGSRRERAVGVATMGDEAGLFVWCSMGGMGNNALDEVLACLSLEHACWHYSNIFNIQDT